MVPADLGWSDIGSWSAVWDVLDHDATGNATDGPVVMLDSRNSLVRSEEPVLTTVVGLNNGSRAPDLPHFDGDLAQYVSLILGRLVVIHCISITGAKAVAKT